MKKCLRCHVEKDEREFNNEKGKEVNYCSKCREYQKRYYEENRDKIEKVKKQYYEENKDKIREYEKKQYIKNRDKRKEYEKKWRTKNKEKRKEYENKWRVKNKGKRLEYGEKWCIKNRDKIREYDKKYREENIDKIREYLERKPKFSSFAHKLTIEEDPICGENGELLVRCAKCKKYFAPINRYVQSRVQALNGSKLGESRLYCSQECRYTCEIYGVKNDPYAKHASVERDPAWAKRIKEEANYVCERCGSKENLEAHHEIPVKVDQSLVNDETNGICLCHDCHMKAHSESGCTLADLRKI